MKIKGPGGYSGVPGPPDDVKKGEGKGNVPFKTETGEVQGSSSSRKSAGPAGAFEACLKEVAKTSGKEGVSGEAGVNRMVDTVLEQMLGKDFLGKPEAASLKAAMVPMLSQDEHFMNRLNKVLTRLQKS
jgi:hypothetical protein